MIDIGRVLTDALISTNVTGPFWAAPEAFVTDTRVVKAGDVYVALSGERFDGHDFVDEALRKGAAAVIVSRAGDWRCPHWRVTDTRLAYGLLARAHRLTFKGVLTAVAGSNGKTTTTQMLYAVLRRAYGERSDATKGNFNNEVGVPRTLLGFQPTLAAAVLETGMNHPGEMARLAHYAAPDVVLITNAQREHQEFLKTVEATAYENGMLIAGLRDAGCAVFPADDDCSGIWASLAFARGVRTMTYATREGVAADVVVRCEGARTAFHTPAGDVAVELQIAGEHNVHNAAGALAASLAAGVPLQTAAEALAEFQALPGRGARTRLGALTLIDDAYNANPDSVRASMAMTAREAGPRIFVLGTMGEVGQNGEAFHREVGAYARELGLDALWCVGELAAHAADSFGLQARTFKTREALIDFLASGLPKAGTITVKASHSAGLEAAVEAIKRCANH